MIQVAWLPEVTKVGDYASKAAFLDAVYEVFLEDFVRHSLTFRVPPFV